MLDKAHLLGLTAPEMVVLYGGLRSIGISTDDKGLWTKMTNYLMSGSKYFLEWT